MYRVTVLKYGDSAPLELTECHYRLQAHSIADARESVAERLKIEFDFEGTADAPMSNAAFGAMCIKDADRGRRTTLARCCEAYGSMRAMLEDHWLERDAKRCRTVVPPATGGPVHVPVAVSVVETKTKDAEVAPLTVLGVKPAHRCFARYRVVVIAFVPVIGTCCATSTDPSPDKWADTFSVDEHYTCAAASKEAARDAVVKSILSTGGPDRYAGLAQRVADKLAGRYEGNDRPPVQVFTESEWLAADQARCILID